MRPLLCTTLSLVLLIALVGQVWADTVTNGSFDLPGPGSFAGWTTTGVTTIETSTFGTGTTPPGPPANTYQASMNTDELNLTPSDTDIESFLGLDSGTLDGLVTPGDAISGSAIKQTVDLSAGEILAFQWNFLTDEASDPNERDVELNDFAFWSLHSEHDGMVLADTFDTSFLPSSPSSAWEQWV